MNSESDFPEFLHAGHDVEIGSHTFEAEEMVAFASQYDPLDIHVDAKAAEKSMIGALCTSGWHTSCIWMQKHRQYSEKMAKSRESAGLPPVQFGPSPGIETIKWLKPVFVGDTITYFNKTLERRPSNSKPGWYILKFEQRGENQHGQAVIKFGVTVLVKYPA